MFLGRVSPLEWSTQKIGIVRLRGGFSNLFGGTTTPFLDKNVHFKTHFNVITIINT